MLLKKCSTCKEELSLDSFSKSSSRKDGLQYICRDCRKELDSKRYLSHKEKSLALNKIWQKNNKVKTSASSRRYYEKNKELCQIKSRIYQKNHPESTRLAYQKRRALELNAEIKIVTLKEIRKLRNGPCFYCAKKGITAIDHVIPLSRGGRHSIGNLVSACITCNTSKHAKYISEWKVMKNNQGKALV